LVENCSLYASWLITVETYAFGDFIVKAQRVEEVRKMSEQYSVDLKERIERKMETMGEKREAQLQSIQERIRDHVRYNMYLVA